jgi:hypothetical protein
LNDLIAKRQRIGGNLIKEGERVGFEFTTSAISLLKRAYPLKKELKEKNCLKSHLVHLHLGVILGTDRLEQEMEVRTYDCSNHA